MIANQYGTFLKFYDESNYQGDSWPEDADGGYIKGTENRYIDPTQHAKAQLLRDAGKPVGFYDFLHGAASGMSMKDQAIYFCDMCDSLQGDFLVADWENSPTPPSEAERDEWAAEVRAYRPEHVNLLYCNRDYWLNKDTEGGRIPELFDGLIIANYNGMPGNPQIQHPWVGHQYSSNPVDANVFNFPTVEAAFTFFRSRMAQAIGDVPAPYVVQFWGVANPDAVYLYTPTPFGGDVRALTLEEWQAMGSPAPRVLAADTTEWQAVVARGAEVPAKPVEVAPPAPQSTPAAGTVTVHVQPVVLPPVDTNGQTVEAPAVSGTSVNITNVHHHGCDMHDVEAAICSDFQRLNAFQKAARHFALNAQGYLTILVGYLLAFISQVKESHLDTILPSPYNHDVAWLIAVLTTLVMWLTPFEKRQ